MCECRWVIVEGTVSKSLIFGSCIKRRCDEMWCHDCEMMTWFVFSNSAPQLISTNREREKILNGNNFEVQSWQYRRRIRLSEAHPVPACTSTHRVKCLVNWQWIGGFSFGFNTHHIAVYFDFEVLFLIKNYSNLRLKITVWNNSLRMLCNSLPEHCRLTRQNESSNKVLTFSQWCYFTPTQKR
jgi:hypothetical protein